MTLKYCGVVLPEPPPGWKRTVEVVSQPVCLDGSLMAYQEHILTIKDEEMLRPADGPQPDAVVVRPC